jgi:hypothetical protein
MYQHARWGGEKFAFTRSAIQRPPPYYISDLKPLQLTLALNSTLTTTRQQTTTHAYCPYDENRLAERSSHYLKLSSSLLTRPTVHQDKEHYEPWLPFSSGELVSCRSRHYVVTMFARRTPVIGSRKSFTMTSWQWHDNIPVRVSKQKQGLWILSSWRNLCEARLLRQEGWTTTDRTFARRRRLR